MPGNQSFYLSRALHSPVILAGSRNHGRLLELLAMDGEPPRITACRLRTSAGIRTVAWEGISLTKVGKSSTRYTFTFDSLRDVEPADSIALKHVLLDRQILDMNGRKVVRVNDIRLAIVSGGTFVIAVDVGMAGLLRRLGIDAGVRRLMETFGGSLSSAYIPWSRMEAFVPGRQGLKLTTDAASLKTLHPSDLADLVERLDRRSQAQLFKSLDAEHAADVLIQMEPEAQAQVLHELPLDSAAALLAQMPSDEVADLLDRAGEDLAEALLGKLDHSASDEVRELMEYPEDAVGALMSTDFLSFRAGDTAGEVLKRLRHEPPEAEELYSLYVTDDGGKLIALVPLPSLVTAPLDRTLAELAEEQHFLFVRDTDSIRELVERVSKYDLVAIPVVDENDLLVGSVIVDDVLGELLRAPGKRWRAG